MAKINGAIIDGTYFQESVYKTKEERKYITREVLNNLVENPKKVVSNWYGEYIAKRKALAEVEDLTDEWFER